MIKRKIPAIIIPAVLLMTSFTAVPHACNAKAARAINKYLAFMFSRLWILAFQIYTFLIYLGNVVQLLIFQTI